ncbi:hypothetical protein ABPG73_008637 [Tetrahymena malaccensis]
MKSLDSGGCVSNLGASILFFTNTLFDSCWSGMFGGALYSSGINITDQIIIKNSKSKIGGGAFVDGGCTGNIRYGCFNQTDACVRGMQQVLNQQSQQMQCKYCDFGTYSNEPTNNCEVCNINNFDECYANNSFLKQNYWRPQNTKYDDTYFCQLNQKSCNSKNRLGYGNDLCSEGYTGAQCLVCDINGEFWRGESYGRDFIRLLSQTILPNQ